MDNDLEIKYKDYMDVLYINFTELVSLNILRKIGEEYPRHGVFRSYNLLYNI